MSFGTCAGAELGVVNDSEALRGALDNEAPSTERGIRRRSRVFPKNIFSCRNAITIWKYEI
jgi:hypothetical protein